MKHIIAVIVLFAGISITAQAAVCEDLSASVDRSLKSIAMHNKNLIDDLGRGASKSDQLMETVAIGNDWQRINIIIQLMSQNKCAPLADATNYSRFSK